METTEVLKRRASAGAPAEQGDRSEFHWITIPRKGWRFVGWPAQAVRPAACQAAVFRAATLVAGAEGVRVRAGTIFTLLRIAALAPIRNGFVGNGWH